MGLTAAQKEDWRCESFCWASTYADMHAISKANVLFMPCSLDEDKIFERLLAENWDAKDRCCMNSPRVKPFSYVAIDALLGIIMPA